MVILIKNQIIFSLIDGPKVEISGDVPADYRVEFIDDDTGLLIYQTVIQPGHWAKADPKYLVNWHIKVREGDNLVFEHKADYHGKKIFIEFSSKALGDTIAWVPFAEEFRQKYQAEIHVKTFWNHLFEQSYKDLHFEEQVPDSGYYAAFRVGAFDSDYHRNKNHWRLVPLQQIASDILGLEPQETRPLVDRSQKDRPIPEKYVAISEFSTFHAKQWLYPGGWQEIVDWLRGQGYQVMSVSKEPTQLANVIKNNGLPIEETIRNLQHADLFIGVSSGLSVLAWGLNIPVVIISGFSLPGHEMKVGCERVINRSACHGCGNDIAYAYDRGNWNLCPRSRNFECSTSITPEMVKGAIKKSLPGDRKGKSKVLLISPHCSTGGGPQYLLKSVQELQKAGHDVAVIEYQNISSDYVVQKNQLKNLCRFYTLNGDKCAEMRDILAKEQPAVVHIQEFSERWMDEKIAAEIYRTDRNYRIVETSHSSEFIGKRFMPDAFAFVSPLHFIQYGDLGIPAYDAEYPIEKKERAPRGEALRKLGLDPNEKHILNVGLFAPWKNQGEIFEVARGLPQYQFHFVGNQAVNFRAYWEPLMADKPDNCVIWGERADVNDFYSAMDLFYFPSTMECNPIVLKEALSWQMPVLMRNLPAYCGSYDDKSGVHFIDDELGNTGSQITSILGNTKIGLAKIYEESLRV